MLFLHAPALRPWVLRCASASLATCPFLLAACGKAPTAAPPPPPPVTVATPLVADVPLLVEAIAQTEATANVQIQARVEGNVEKIAFTEGSEVAEGDLLFELDKEPVNQRINAAKANVGQLAAALAKAKQDVDRLTPLAKSRAVPQKDLDSALAMRDQAEEALKAGDASVESAVIDLGYTTIRAPVSGVIGAKGVDIGTYVGKGQPTVMATISPLDPIWANIEISEVTYLRVAEKMKADKGESAVFSLLLPDGTVHPHTGKLAFVDRAVDPTTGTLRIRVQFPNPEKILRPGQFCRVRVLSKEVTGALLLPQRAIQEIQGTYSVFVVDAEGKALFRPVTVGPTAGSLRIIESGLEATDQVIIEGWQKARNDSPVTPQPTEISDDPLVELRAMVPVKS